MKVKCIHCGKEFAEKGIHTHIWRKHGDGITHLTGKLELKGKQIWNKGLTKSTSEIVKQISETLSKARIGKPGRPHTEKSKLKLSKKLSINNKGGRCKWFDVNGQKLQGTWEKQIAEILTSKGVEWLKIKTNQHTFTYSDNKSYSPDFYLPKFNLYLEIKGYWWGNDKDKMKKVLEAYPTENFLIIEEKEFKRILQGEPIWETERTKSV